MANLPRFGRTWQRFSSLPRPGTAPRPEIQATAEPEVYPSAQATTNILQTSPARERASAISSPVRKYPSPPSSPIYRAAATTSPKAFKTALSPPRSPPLPRSPRHEPVRSRSPPEVQQKSVLYQKTTTAAEKAAKTEHRASEYSSGKPHQKQHQQQSDVINIKGENVGAVMHITESPSGGTEIHKKNPMSTVTHHSNNEDNDELKTNKKASTSSSSLPGKSFMNTNFQGVNNSILYNSSLTHRDPGLHLAFSNKPPHSPSHSTH